MHSENASDGGVSALLGRDVVVAVDADVVAPDGDAAVGLFELPPQPASRIPLANAAAVSSRVHDRRISRRDSMLAYICFPSGVVSGCAHPFYATGGFATVSHRRTTDRVMRSPRSRRGPRQSGHEDSAQELGRQRAGAF
jgi:hypothetical protein